MLDNIDSNRPEGQGVEYEGEIDFFDQPHGKGTMTFENGSKIRYLEPRKYRSRIGVWFIEEYEIEYRTYPIKFELKYY